jgi:uncharacterized protein (DUF488 family)
MKQQGDRKDSIVSKKATTGRRRMSVPSVISIGEYGKKEISQTRLEVNKNPKPVIFSIGYEGKTIFNFISILKDAGAKQLIDVRENPFSFKKGFSKTPLMENLIRVGIKYQHIKELGTERQSRKEYKQTGNLSKLCKTFAKRLENNREKYETLLALANKNESAIMCFEENYRMCHRQVLERNLEKDGFEVVHLCNGRQKKS